MARSHAQTNDHLPSLSAPTLTAAVPIDNPKTYTHRTRKHSDVWEHNYKYVLFLYTAEKQYALYMRSQRISPQSLPLEKYYPSTVLFTVSFKGSVHLPSKKGVTSADRSFPICIVFAAACTLSRGHLYIWWLTSNILQHQTLLVLQISK